MKECIKNVVGGLFIIAGVIGGLYVGGWLMFISPIIEAIKAFDAGTLTGMIIGVTILKCVFASFVGCIISRVGVYIGLKIKL